MGKHLLSVCCIMYHHIDVVLHCVVVDVVVGQYVSMGKPHSERIHRIQSEIVVESTPKN